MINKNAHIIFKHLGTLHCQSFSYTCSEIMILQVCRMTSIDLEKMLDKVKNTQWTLSDIDWDAPGKELITAEQ